ncbi:MAG: hypothetical protein Q3976_06485 [Corynebacterium sp.]|nr:hypothetical protein [Corynebacterium sp.]
MANNSSYNLAEINDKAAETWNSLGERKQNLLVVCLAWDVLTKLWAWHLLFWTPKERVKGKKFWWFLATFIDGIGSPAFIFFGRKKKNKAKKR